MKIWRICKAAYAPEAFSGEGARRFGGRWNSRGVPMVYSSTSLALAAMELFVHLEPGTMPNDLVAVAAELPAGEPAQTWEPDTLPPKWWSDEFAPMHEHGDRWTRSRQCLAVLVPSVPIRPEWNVLINPLHPSIHELRAGPAQPFNFDARMFTAATT